MLIQALCQYYDMNTEKVIGGLPKYFEKVEISYMIFLTQEGKISSIQDIRETVEIAGKKKPVVRKKTMVFPIRSDKSSIVLNIAEHRPLYIFGLNYDKKSDSFTPEDNTNKAKKSHECFVNGNLEFCEGLDSPIINAFREFLINWNPADETENPHLKAISKDYSNAYYCFALEGRPDILLNNDALLKKKYTEYAESKESDSQSGKTLSMCPIEGKMLPVSKTHNKIKMKGDSILVGCNIESSESYDKIQAYNSNISEKAMKKYTAALNYLLKNSQHHTYLDDMTLFYFGLSPDDEEECDYFSQILNGSDDDGEGTELRGNLHAAAKAFQNGTVPDISVFTKNNDFIIAGVTLNKSRISIRFLFRKSFGNIMKNLLQHQHDLKTENHEKSIPMWLISKEFISPKEKKEKAPPPLQSAIMLAAMNGTRYPDAMLHTVLRRIKTDDSMGAEFGAIKIGLIKAYLNRKARLSNNKEEITLALNTENKNPAYLCGRLFAVLEKIQLEASRDKFNRKIKLNRTIKDSFFASACTRPVSVFPRLLKLSQNHMAKLIDDQNWQDLIGEIINDIDGQFPSTMPPDDQGRFIIGYYQQKNALWDKKSTETGKED